MKILKRALLSCNGVSLQHHILDAMVKVDKLHWTNANLESTWTSLVDGKHMEHSRHYVGLAADLRIWYLSCPQAFAQDIRDLVGNDYDVVFEADHIHIEFDPER